jgi:hypothetical protein
MSTPVGASTLENHRHAGRLLLVTLVVATAGLLGLPGQAVAQDDDSSSSTRGRLGPVPGEYNKAGRWTLGINSAFNLTRSRNELETGGERTNSTMFLRLAPTVSTFFIDKLETALSVGMLARQLSRTTDTNPVETAWLFELKGGYHVEFTPRLSLIPALGLGFYIGSSQSRRSIVDQDTGNETTLEVDTNTRGFSGVLSLNLAYALSPHWQLRAGLLGSLLAGTETVSQSDSTLSATTWNLSTNFSFIFYF